MSARQTASAPAPVIEKSATASSSLKPQDLRVQLHYLKDDPIYQTQKPLQVTPNFQDSEGRTNVRLVPGEFETLYDVRGKEARYSLDRHGFKYVRAPTKFADWESQPKIGQKHLPELEALLRREVEGCDEILFYDARLRFAEHGGARVDGLSYNPFARQVHTDNTEKSVLAKIRTLTDMKADYLLSGRCRIINIWRPIKHPVYDCGLAIADGGKLKEGDVIECDRHRADTGEYWDTMGVAQYRPGFEWHYMSRQSQSDVLLFKNYDSATHVRARTCLHTAFDVPADMVPPNTPTRESIEVRALIFTYPEHSPRPAGGLNMQHPLAVSLEQSHLKPVEFDYGLTGRVRNDIDEASEVKDAVLLLRKREIRRLERVQKQLEAERDHLRNQLQCAHQQIDIQADELVHLQTYDANLRRDIAAQQTVINEEFQNLFDRLDRDRIERAARSQDNHWADNLAQIQALTQQLHRANSEVDKWKAEAMGRGNEAVSQCWQNSVDEAIQREREKDAIVIESLRAEIEALKMGRT